MAATKEKIQKTTKPNAIMTADFQCELLDCCLALSKLPVWDVLLYVKLYMSMDGDDTLLHEEAERAVRTWMELQEQSRIEILIALMARRTEGVFPDTHVAYQKNAS